MTTFGRAVGTLSLLSLCLGAGCTGAPHDLEPACGGGGDARIPTEPALAFQAFAAGAAPATDFAFLPGRENELLVLSQSGGIRHISLTCNGTALLGETQATVFFDEGCGLHSIVVDPQFQDNGFIYMTRCVDTLTSTLTRHVAFPLSQLESSGKEILSTKLDEAQLEDWHRFGSFGFESDGVTMWLLVGDHFARDRAQDPSNLFGTLIRFLPNREPNGEGHAEPRGPEPEPGTDPRVYAFGFRSPWRGSRDKQGRYFVGDVGLRETEEVNVVERYGQNFGWDTHEGPCKTNCEGVTDPITSYGRAIDEPYALDDPDTEPAVRRAVWVGQKYEDASVDRYYGLMDGFVPFGDFFTGWVRGLRVNEATELLEDRLLGHLAKVTSMKLGPDGYWYVLTLDGKLHRAQQADF